MWQEMRNSPQFFLRHILDFFFFCRCCCFLSKPCLEFHHLENIQPRPSCLKCSSPPVKTCCAVEVDSFCPSFLIQACYDRVSRITMELLTFTSLSTVFHRFSSPESERTVRVKQLRRLNRADPGHPARTECSYVPLHAAHSFQSRRGNARMQKS